MPGATFTLQVPESSPWHGKPLTVREFRWMNSHPVAFFEGVDDRDAAEELIRAILWIDQDAATAAPEDNAWYDHQLVGLDVVRDGVVVGRVIRVEHFPSQDLLVVRPTGAGADAEVLVPFVAAIVPEVDIEAGRVVVTPPPGLFEELPGDDEPEPDSRRRRGRQADDSTDPRRVAIGAPSVPRIIRSMSDRRAGWLLVIVSGALAIVVCLLVYAPGRVRRAFSRAQRTRGRPRSPSCWPRCPAS